MIIPPIIYDFDISQSSSHLMAEHRPLEISEYEPNIKLSGIDYISDINLLYDSTYWSQSETPSYYMSKKEQQVIHSALLSSVKIIND